MADAEAPLPKPTPLPDPEARRRVLAAETLALRTAAPTPMDLDIIERLTGIGCVNILHNSARRAMSCPAGLGRSCPPRDRDSEEADALARGSWSLLSGIMVAINFPRTWAEAQRCASHLLDAKHVSTLTLAMAERLSAAKHYQALLACLHRCSLTAKAKARVAKLEGGRGTVARIEGRLVEAEDKLKSLKTIETASEVFTSLDGTRKHLAARKAVDARTRAGLNARINAVENGIKKLAPKLTREAIKQQLKRLNAAIVLVRQLLRVRDVDRNIAKEAPKLDNMLSDATDLTVDIKRIGGKELIKHIAPYERRLARLAKRWKRLEPRLKRRAAQLIEGELVRTSACVLYLRLRDDKKATKQQVRKRRREYQRLRRKLRRLRARFRPQKACVAR